MFLFDFNLRINKMMIYFSYFFESGGLRALKQEEFVMVVTQFHREIQLKIEIF